MVAIFIGQPSKQPTAASTPDRLGRLSVNDQFPIHLSKAGFTIAQKQYGNCVALDQAFMSHHVRTHQYQAFAFKGSLQYTFFHVPRQLFGFRGIPNPL